MPSPEGPLGCGVLQGLLEVTAFFVQLAFLWQFDLTSFFLTPRRKKNSFSSPSTHWSCWWRKQSSQSLCFHPVVILHRTQLGDLESWCQYSKPHGSMAVWGQLEVILHDTRGLQGDMWPTHMSFPLHQMWAERGDRLLPDLLVREDGLSGWWEGRP